MAYPKGKPRPPTSGRKKGSLNKKTAEVHEILARLKFNPVEELVELYRLTCNEDNTVATAAKCLTELLQYVYPKRKAIEHTGKDGEAIQVSTGLEHIPTDELLKLLPTAVEILKKKDQK